ncbi:hypothetical protein FHG87_000738 [Trinorchestia longiramus]|nr:hypothetical protein FHG87_000738 [Trinorchestia longiramus]
MILSFASLLLLLQLADMGRGAPASITVLCHVQSLVHVTCHLPDIIRDQRAVNISVTVNNCHEPVDVTFAMTGFQLSWNFTFVPNNQNERVLIPNVYMIEPEPPVPTYLYVREPGEENRERNGSSIGTNITVQASLMAQLVQNNIWEEVEFFNHTFRLPAQAPHCPPLHSERGPHFEAGHWLTKMLVLVAGILAVASAMLIVALKRQQLVSLAHAFQDRLNLVQHEQHGDAHPQINNEASPEYVSADIYAAQSMGAQRGTAASSISNSQPTVRDFKSTLDSSALKYFNEVYPDEKLSQTSSVIPEPSSSRTLGNPKAILFKMMKAKKEIEIGLKGISFEKLKEDSASKSNNFSNPDNNQASHFEVVNPGYIPEDSNNLQMSVKTDSGFPLNDDFGASDECDSNISIKNRSDSYTNVFETSDQREDLDVPGSGWKRENPKWKVNFQDDENLGHVEVNGLENKQKRFGYDSREYLDELEGATAVFPEDKQSKKKRSKSLKIDKQKRERDARPYRQERNGHRRSNGRRTSFHEKAKVDIIHEVEDKDNNLDKKVSPPKVEDKYVNQKRRRRSCSPPDGRAIVRDVLQQGFFNYRSENKSSSQDDSLTRVSEKESKANHAMG